MRILDTKNSKEQEILINAPALIDYIDKDSQIKYNTILEHLSKLGIGFTHSNKLVRGMDYYSDFVFEVVTDNLGSQSAVLAGGRYDNLILEMGGPSCSAAGFAGGIERIIDLVYQNGEYLESNNQVYLVPIGLKAEMLSTSIAQSFREAKISILVEYDFSLKKRMRRANKLKARYSIIFGNNELEKNIYILKDMRNGQEERLNQSSIINYLTKSK